MINNLTPETYSAAVADMCMESISPALLYKNGYKGIPVSQFVRCILEPSTNAQLIFITGERYSGMKMVQFVIDINNTERLWNTIHDAVLNKMTDIWQEIRTIDKITPELLTRHPVLMFIIQISAYPVGSPDLIRSRYIDYSIEHLYRNIPSELVFVDEFLKDADISVSIGFTAKTGYRGRLKKSHMEMK